MSLRILALAGSARRDSYNRKLLGAMADGARKAGAEVEIVDWRDYDLPLMNEDVEAAGPPEAARRFKAALRSADALLIATPENNGGYPSLLKNAIDWASRGLGDPPGRFVEPDPLVLCNGRRPC